VENAFRYFHGKVQSFSQQYNVETRQYCRCCDVLLCVAASSQGCITAQDLDETNRETPLLN
jgi:hypothetical protein